MKTPSRLEPTPEDDGLDGLRKAAGILTFLAFLGHLLLRFLG